MSIRRWQKVDFGKYFGLTLLELLFTDPDYFCWAIESQAFEGSMRVEANELYRRATAIRIPAAYGDGVAVEYAVDPRTGKFEGMSLVRAELEQDGGSSRSIIKGVIDMSIPHRQRSFDKGGNRIVLRDMKAILLGSSRYRMTKKVRESYFNNEDNFALDGTGGVT